MALLTSIGAMLMRGRLSVEASITNSLCELHKVVKVTFFMDLAALEPVRSKKWIAAQLGTSGRYKGSDHPECFESR